MSGISRTGALAGADLPRVVDGAFDMADLEAWLIRTEGGYRRRMIGHDLEHLGIRHGDLLIAAELQPLRYGGVAMRLVGDFNDGPARVAGAGQVFRDADGDPAMLVDAQAWRLTTEAFSYVVPVLGSVPVRGGWVVFAEAQVLPQGGEEVSWPKRDEAALRRLEMPLQDLPF